MKAPKRFLDWLCSICTGLIDLEVNKRNNNRLEKYNERVNIAAKIPSTEEYSNF